MTRFRIATGLIAAALLASPASAVIAVGSDPILYWNTVALANLPGGPPAQARAAAMVNIAMYDAVNAALGRPNVGYTGGVSATGGDVRAAASQAAYGVLMSLNSSPAAQANFTNALNSSLALSDPSTRAAGVATGSAYASAVIASRAADGSTNATPYTPGTNPGEWRPVSGSAAAALPNWGKVTPFVLSSGSQVYPGAPPTLDSAAYAAAYNEVKTIGAAGAELAGNRTADQTASALFWNNSNGLTWLQIGTIVAENKGLDTLSSSRAFALLTTSIADAFIAGFDAKYLHEVDLWRPATAIRLGDTDGNAATIGDATWASLIVAPNHPSYVSTHSAQSGAGASILSSIYGEEAFSLTIGDSMRTFSSLSAAATDGANSRLWGGIHFSFDNAAGLQVGQGVAAVSLRDRAFGAVPEPASWMMMIVGFGLTGAMVRRRRMTVPVLA